ncbi:MAG: serine acetyltransferase [Verrucomicrobia bacterium]|nr:serine acetyltransferase [Verrucomicrobiota bacterium]
MANFFPLGDDVQSTIDDAICSTVRSLEYCFRHINHPSYNKNGVGLFDVLNSDHYASFLCLLGREVHRMHPHHPVAQKCFLLNKALHGLNCMYDVELPPVFWLLHTVGSVIGKAKYGNYLVVRQGCTIGAMRGEYPVIGEGFIMSSACSIIGASVVGDNVMLAPNTVILGENIGPNTLVSGHYAHGLTCKEIGRRPLNTHFFFE